MEKHGSEIRCSMFPRKSKPSSQFTHFPYRLHSFICKSLGFLGNSFSFVYVILDVSISIESTCGIEREVFGFSKDSVGMGKVNTPLNLLSELNRTDILLFQTQWPVFLRLFLRCFSREQHYTFYFKRSGITCSMEFTFYLCRKT